MKFLVMIYCDDSMLAELPDGQFDTMMRGCLDKADDLKRKGILLDSQKLEAPRQSRTMRIRQGNTTIVDGPFAETKEYLGGFNLIEARDMDEAIEIAKSFPWASIGSIEVRPVASLGDRDRQVLPLGQHRQHRSAPGGQPGSGARARQRRRLSADTKTPTRRCTAGGRFVLARRLISSSRRLPTPPPCPAHKRWKAHRPVDS